jgi:hypothetical protein
VNVIDWIACHAQWLIACWDGVDNEEENGGTAHAIRIFRQGSPRPDLKPPHSGPVTRLFTTRNGSPGRPSPRPPKILCPQAPDLALTKANLAKEGRRMLDLRKRSLQSLDQFNRRAAAILASDPESVDQSRGYLGPMPSSHPQAQRAAQMFGFADRLSTTAQGQWKRWLMAFIALSVTALGAHQMFSTVPHGHEWWHWGWLMVSLLLVLAMLVPIAVGQFPLGSLGILQSLNVKAVAEQYMDYRALAEAARVQYFWKLLGLPECAADFHLLDQREA